MLVEVGKEAKGADEERKIEGAGEQGEGAKDGSREGSRGGIQQAEGGQSPSWGKRSLCVVQGVGGRKLRKYGGRQSHPLRVRGKKDQRLAVSWKGCLCSPNTCVPLPSGP